MIMFVNKLLFNTEHNLVGANTGVRGTLACHLPAVSTQHCLGIHHQGIIQRELKATLNSAGQVHGGWYPVGIFGLLHCLLCGLAGLSM